MSHFDNERVAGFHNHSQVKINGSSKSNDHQTSSIVTTRAGPSQSRKKTAFNSILLFSIIISIAVCVDE